MRARTGTFILSCCVKQCVLLLHNPNRGLAGLALGLGINFFSKSDSILVIDNGSIGEISAHFHMLLIGFWNAVTFSKCTNWQKMLVLKLLNYTNSDFLLQKNLNQPGKILGFAMILISLLSLLLQQKSFHCRMSQQNFIRQKYQL